MSHRLRILIFLERWRQWLVLDLVLEYIYLQTTQYIYNEHGAGSSSVVEMGLAELYSVRVYWEPRPQRKPVASLVRVVIR